MTAQAAHGTATDPKLFGGVVVMAIAETIRAVLFASSSPLTEVTQILSIAAALVGSTAGVLGTIVAIRELRRRSDGDTKSNARP